MPLPPCASRTADADAGGLINRKTGDRQQRTGVGTLPILGRLFSSHSDTAAKTEVVLLITPHVVRNIVRPESPVEEFPSGTESAISLERMEINPTEATGGEKSAELAPVGSDTAAAANPAVPPAAPVLGNVKLALNVPPQVQSGKAFTVGVNLAAEGLQNAMLSLSYDPAKLKVVSVAEGDFLKKPDGKTQFPPGSGQDRAH